MPPKLIPHITPSTQTITIGIAGSRRLCKQLCRQVDSAVCAIAIADERDLQIVVDTWNSFGKNMLRRAAGLRNTFPRLKVIALTSPMTYKNYLGTAQLDTIDNLMHILSLADEIALFRGRSPAGTIYEQHQMMAEVCNIIFDGYSLQDAQLSKYLVRAITGKAVKHAILSDFSDREIRYLNSVCRRLELPEIGKMGADELPES